MANENYELDKDSQEQLQWAVNDEGDLKAWIPDEDGSWKEVVWAPQPGSQEAFLACPVFEVLYEGTRGPGKTDALLMDFAQHVGQGYGADWSGVLFRQTYPELEDVIAKTKKWFPQIFPQATYNRAKTFWEFPDGEILKLRHAKKEDDYWSYHGHAFPWIGWEELTNWASPALYLRLRSCCRSTRADMPRKYRATANPYGAGHNWVKARFRLPVPSKRVVGPVIKDALDRDGKVEPPRVAIHGHLLENKILLHGDPEYIGRLRSAASNQAELRAWIHGDWNIVAGGMFDDLWRADHHIVPNLPFQMIPPGWRVDRSYDHGQSSPFSVGWWAESNGEPVQWNGRLYGQVRGDVYRIAEWYGWNGHPNEGIRMLATDIAQGIVDRETDWGIHHRAMPGPADNQIFDDTEPGKSVAGDMKKFPYRVKWTRADKSPGSRRQGWQQLRKLMRGALPSSTGVREEPGLFVMERCTQFTRTVPALSRAKNDPDDVDTDTEDHIGDESRYRVRSKDTRPSQRRWK